MVQTHGHKSEQALGDVKGQGSLACCGPWGHKELDMTEQLKNNHKFIGRTDVEAETPIFWPPDVKS